MLPAVCFLNIWLCYFGKVTFPKRNYKYHQCWFIVIQMSLISSMSSRGHTENKVLLSSVWTNWRKQHWMGYWLFFTWLRTQVELLWRNLFFKRMDSASIFVCCSEVPEGTVFGDVYFPSHWFLIDSTPISSHIRTEQKPSFFKDTDLMTVCVLFH